MDRFGVFFCKSLDLIVDPKFNNQKIPCQIFDIGNMLTVKMLKANQLEFYSLMRYVHALKGLVKYHIGMA